MKMNLWNAHLTFDPDGVQVNEDAKDHLANLQARDNHGELSGDSHSHGTERVIGVHQLQHDHSFTKMTT